MYCLEQSLRTQEKYIPISEIFSLLEEQKMSYPDDTVLSFYGWNPLLHPDIEKIIHHADTLWFHNISLLTNTKWLTQKKIDRLSEIGLRYMSVYFHTFSKEHHNKIVQWWVSLEELLGNIQVLSRKNMLVKLIIHINKQNLHFLYKDILKLYKVFWVRKIDFINYFPFDRPYDAYHQELFYDYYDCRQSISALFEVLKKYSIESQFMKFPQAFFWRYNEYYDYHQSVENQIWLEDRERLSSSQTPFCKKENRCNICFIQDSCSFYGI